MCEEISSEWAHSSPGSPESPADPGLERHSPQGTGLEEEARSKGNGVRRWRAQLSFGCGHPSDSLAEEPQQMSGKEGIGRPWPASLGCENTGSSLWEWSGILGKRMLPIRKIDQSLKCFSEGDRNHGESPSISYTGGNSGFFLVLGRAEPKQEGHQLVGADLEPWRCYLVYTHFGFILQWLVQRSGRVSQWRWPVRCQEMWQAATPLGAGGTQGEGCINDNLEGRPCRAGSPHGGAAITCWN